MRARLMVAGVILTAATSASAQAPFARPPTPEFKWCYVEPPPFSSRHCQFRSIEECRVEIPGMGGYCSLNPRYVEPPPSKARKGRTSTR